MVEHLILYHRLLTSTLDTPRVAVVADFFTHEGRYVVDPVEKINVCRELVESRVLRKSDDVAVYGVDPTMEVPPGELVEDVAVHAPSDTSYRQVTGPMRSTVRDGLCLVCTNDSWAVSVNAPSDTSYRAGGGRGRERSV